MSHVAAGLELMEALVLQSEAIGPFCCWDNIIVQREDCFFLGLSITTLDIILHSADVATAAGMRVEFDMILGIDI